MAFLEKRYRRNGIEVPIQCIKVKMTQSGRQKSFHYHDYTELLFGLSGEVVAYVGNESYRLTEGSMLIVHNYDIHDVLGTGIPSEYIVVKFLPSILFTAEQTLSEYSYALLLLQNTHTRKTFFTKEELADTAVPSLFIRLMDEWYGEKFGYELSLRADVTVIFMHIMRKWRDENPNLVSGISGSAHSELLHKAISIIDTDYATVTETECAARIGLSPSYFSRIFKSVMQVSFPDYVNRIRMRNAERLLLSGDVSITEISECVGFSSCAYFISCFRKAYGTTPAKYRKRLRGE